MLTIYANLKNLLKQIYFRLPFAERLSISHVVKKKLLPSILIQSDARDVKKSLFLPSSPHSSQLNQDIFALIFNNFKPGFFLEIGANDGFSFSNTIYLEEEYKWQGILIEANPSYYEKLKKRKAKISLAAISDKEETLEFRDAGLFGGLEHTLDKSNPDKIRNKKTIKVEGKRLSSILEELEAPKKIDFVSIDVEGGELEILRQLVSMNNYQFKCGCIEHNYRKKDKEEIKNILLKSDFCIAWEAQTSHDFFFYKL